MPSHCEDEFNRSHSRLRPAVLMIRRWQDITKAESNLVLSALPLTNEHRARPSALKLSHSVTAREHSKHPLVTYDRRHVGRMASNQLQLARNRQLELAQIVEVCFSLIYPLMAKSRLLSNDVDVMKKNAFREFSTSSVERSAYVSRAPCPTRPATTSVSDR